MSTLFPFPEPTFLFIHQVTLQRRTGTTTDSRGRAVPTYAPEPLDGFLTAPNPESVPDVGGLRTRVSAVFLASLSTVVDVADMLDTTGAPVAAVLQGQFKIEMLRPNESHLRILLSRYTGSWEAQQ